MIPWSPAPFFDEATEIAPRFAIMEEAFRAWFDRSKNEPFSMATTETLDFCEGRAQLKWWKLMGVIIVKEIKLNRQHRGRGEFTAVVAKMLHWPGVRTVEMESVLSDECTEKLAASGFWKRKPYNPGTLIASGPENDNHGNVFSVLA